MRRFFTSSVLCSSNKSRLPKSLPTADDLYNDFQSQYDPNWRKKSYKSSVQKTKNQEPKVHTEKLHKGEKVQERGQNPNRKERRRLLFPKNEVKAADSQPAEPEAEPEAEIESGIETDNEHQRGLELPNPTHVCVVSSKDVEYNQYIVSGQPPVPPLANNLDKVLFNPGVHFLKDIRTNVYNFPPSLENIMSIRDFDFTKVPAFVPSGKDNKLSCLAQKENKRYTASTSSITGVLGQLHGALSYGRQPSLMGMSKYFKGRTTTFTASQKMPTRFILRYNDATNTHAIAPISSDGGDETILSLLGQAMETMLVTDTKQFANYDRLLSHCLPKEEPLSTYNYMECGSFMLRSQLDCHDPRLPGTGYFDLKTRAVCAVRHDMDYSQIKDGCDYQIIKRDGFEESYAREFYELIRSALFKYSLQGRIGSMDGIFVAYHNINNLFGFEYLPLEDIDVIFHTSHLFTIKDPKSGYKIGPEMHEKAAKVGPLIAEKEFGLSIGVLEKILDTITKDGPQKDYLVYLHNTGINGITVVCREYDEAKEGGCSSDAATQQSDALSSFRCVLNGSVNGVKVAPGQHPHIESKDDVWEVALEIEHADGEQVSADFKKLTDGYVPFTLTSKPAVERSENDELLEKEAMSKLEGPSAFQKRLRELQEKGKLYKQESEAREKVVWEPKWPKN